MRRVAILPARGGSKRIPRKNTKLFLEKPMICWPLDALRESGLFHDVFVSTDDEEIADIAVSYGFEALDRPAALADDYSHTTQVVQSVIREHLSDHDNLWVYKIYPTSPIDSEIVEGFVAFTEEREGGMTLSVSKSPVPTQRALRMLDDLRMEFREPEYSLTRTQDLDPTYFDAGKLYAGTKHDWLATQTPLLSSARGFELPDWLSVDLDTVEDWEFAEYKLRRRFGTN